jgi:hypothetical protein
MPGVRYGPDISDDAAYFVDQVKEIQAKIRAGKKPTPTETARLKNAALVAKNIFGVGKRDFDKGKLGEMAEMARYGGSKPLSRRAKDSRDGTSMTKSVAEELLDRSTGRNSRGSRTRPAEGTYYEGRTRSKRFKELEANATARLNNKGMPKNGTQKAVKRGSVNPSTFKDSVDRLQIAKTRGASSDLLNRVRGGSNPASRQRKAGVGIRPPLAKSQAKASQRKKKGPKPKKAASATRAAGNQARTRKAVKKA